MATKAVSNRKSPPTPAKRGPKSPMTAQHKQALARGRSEGRAIRDYLEDLRANKPRRGRRRTADSIRARLEVIETNLRTADALDEVRLVQERRDLSDELNAASSTVDRQGLEDAFVKAVASYSNRQGIAYASWREVGVSAAVLRRAGVTR